MFYLCFSSQFQLNIKNMLLKRQLYLVVAMKLSIIAALLAVSFMPSAFSCTTILVGDKATADGSYIIARNADHNALTNQHYFHHPRTEHAKGVFHSSFNDFSYPIPAISLGFDSFAKAMTHDHSWGSAGFNEAGVGMTATETIFNNPKVLTIDPYNEKSGINEDSIINVILPRAKTAKEGVEILGNIIEEKGTAEGFGVAFVDKDGIWYLETASGHQWMAIKLNNQDYFVSANQGRLNKYNPNDPEHYLANKNLISFAEQHGFYNPKKDGVFDFHKVYSKDDKTDIRYNYPRVIRLQHRYNPNLQTVLSDPLAFPVFVKPEKLLTVADIKEGLRDHYQGTKDDPYTQANPHVSKRPISVFRTYESNILQVRPNLPKAIGEVTYIGWGMTALTPYIPFYQGAKIPHIFREGNSNADEYSAFWQLRTVQTLAMVDYNQFAPLVQTTYKKMEQAQAKLMKQTEREYLALYKNDPQAAQNVLDNFEVNIANLTMETAKKLQQQLITKLTKDIDDKYHFAGA